MRLTQAGLNVHLIAIFCVTDGVQSIQQQYDMTKPTLSNPDNEGQIIHHAGIVLKILWHFLISASMQSHLLTMYSDFPDGIFCCWV